MVLMEIKAGPHGRIFWVFSKSWRVIGKPSPLWNNTTNSKQPAMATPLYARYIPPKPAAPKPVIVPASPTPTPKSSIAEDLPKDKIKRTKDRPTKRKRENENIVEEEDSGEVSKKHKSVFSKFEKSSKLADAARKSLKGTIVEELRESPAPKLHGKNY